MDIQLTHSSESNRIGQVLFIGRGTFLKMYKREIMGWVFLIYFMPKRCIIHAGIETVCHYQRDEYNLPLHYG